MLANTRVLATDPVRLM